MTGKKSFTLYSRTKKSFDIFLASFDYAVTFLFRIRNKIEITFVSSAINKLIEVFNLKRIRIVISQMKLVGKIVSFINLKRVRLIILFREIGKISSTIKIKSPLTFVSRAFQKIVSTIILKKIKITITPTLATFFSLGYYDPSTLLVMDAETLGDLDYIVA